MGLLKLIMGTSLVHFCMCIALHGIDPLTIDKEEIRLRTKTYNKEESSSQIYMHVFVQDSMVSIYSFFDLHLSQSARISICSDFDLHGFRSAIQNIFQSARISICTVFALQFLDLQRFRSAQYSICTDFDLHGFRSTCISICKSILDLWIFRSANQISIYRFFDLQIKFRSTDFSICKSSFDLQIV